MKVSAQVVSKFFVQEVYKNIKILTIAYSCDHVCWTLLGNVHSDRYTEAHQPMYILVNLSLIYTRKKHDGYSVIKVNSQPHAVL